MTSHRYACDVPFVAGKGRPRGQIRMVRNKRLTIHTYTPDATTMAERDVREAFMAQNPDAVAAPAGVPVTLMVATDRPLPKSRPKRIESEPDTVTPDADNVLKLIQDALNGVAWDDDKQVTQAAVIKRDRTRDTQERTHIEVRWADGIEEA